MLNYKTFKNNEDFVQWQKDNEGVNIQLASPIVNEAGIDIGEYDDGTEYGKSSDGKLEVNIGLFVLYLTED